MSYTYHFPTLWNNKAYDAVVTERHDIALLFDATNCNPNGDPDTGNMPRLQPDTLRGLVTDVCLKRKVRNFFGLHDPSGTPRTDGRASTGYRIFIRENAVLQQEMEQDDIALLAEQEFNKSKDPEKGNWKRPPKGKDGKEGRGANDAIQRAYRDAVCRSFFDVRAFGAVVSTSGPMQGSFYGQIRGPLQITFAESLDKVLQLDFSITRCAVASLKEQKQQEKQVAEEAAANRTMGRKHTVPYGLYRCHIHFSPAFAAKTHFTYADLDNFLFALTRCLGDFNVDSSSARPGGMRVVGLVDFEHKDALGNAPAHKLFEMVKVAGKKDDEGKFGSGSEFPQGLADYVGSAPDGLIYVEKNKYEQVTACTEKKPAPKDGNEPIAPITAHRIIWEIPEVVSLGAKTP